MVKLWNYQLSQPLSIVPATQVIFSTSASADNIAENYAELIANGESEFGDDTLTVANTFLEQAVRSGKQLFEHKIKWFKPVLQEGPELPLSYMDISASYFQLKDYVEHSVAAISITQPRIKLNYSTITNHLADKETLLRNDLL